MSWEKESHGHPSPGILAQASMVTKHLCAYTHVHMGISAPSYLFDHRRICSLSLPCSHYLVHTWVGSTWPCG